MRIRFFLTLFILFVARSGWADSDPLAVGIAGHAFDHLGDIADQAQTAAANGATIIYSTGFGSLGYEGIPNEQGLRKTHDATSAYLQQAKAKGIRLAIGYVCATSIVKVETFAKNWSPEFRAQFATPPSAWMQQDKDGKALPSWYGGDYHPACMNNPDWRTYEKFMVRQQLEAGHDGIFFDNPTVHPQGCYCEYCLKKFGKFLENEGAKVDVPQGGDVGAMRKLALSRQKDFLRFRATIASDFLSEIRQFARTIKPEAIITCNNSLNSPEVLFSQSQTYGYNIFEMSKVEDLVVVEDMGTHPRVLANGAAVEYGPVYEMLQAISHGKPIVAVTLAEADYHTPANLMRLAMAEAAAHGASYLSWPTWAVNQRERMVAGVRPEADFLKEHSELLNGVEPAADVLLFFPHRRWIESADCPALASARALAAANVQFRVVCEEDLGKAIGDHAPEVLVAESSGVLNEGEKKLVEDYQLGGGQVVWSADAGWLKKAQGLLARPVIEVEGSPNVRAVVRRKGNQTIVHLLNLNVQRVSSYEDRVNPASAVKLKIRVGATLPKSVQALTADVDATRGAVAFKLNKAGDAAAFEITVPRVNISTILVIE